MVRDILNRLRAGNKRGDEGRPPARPAEVLPGNAAADAHAEPPAPDSDADSGDLVNEADYMDNIETQEDTTLDDAVAIEDDLGRTVPLRPIPGSTSLTDTMISTGRSEPAFEEPVMRAAQCCHIGAIRGRNEDSCLLFVSSTGGQDPLLPFGLFIVADGMGGHHAGHEASKQVSRSVARHVLTNIYLPLLDAERLGQPANRRPIQEVLMEAVQAANMVIFSSEPEKESGTTLTAALVFGRRLYLAHVGDSRAYLYSDGQLELVTTDHSYVRRLQEAGQLTAEEAASHPQRNVLYRAVGQGNELEIDIFTRPLPKKGKLILCSDGLWGLVPEPIVTQVLDQDISLQKMVDTLVDMAIQAGGHDNITGVLVDFAL